MLVFPTQAAENSYIPLPGMLSDSIFGLFILEDWQIDLHPQTTSCPSCSVTLSRPLIMVNWWELCLPNWNSLPLKREIHQRCLLTKCVVPCLLCLLLLLPTCWEWVFLLSVPQLFTLPFLTSTLKSSSSKPCMHSSMLYVAVGVQFVFIVP